MGCSFFFFSLLTVYKQKATKICFYCHIYLGEDILWHNLVVVVLYVSCYLHFMFHDREMGED